MKAIIIGAGKLGFSIAQILSEEGHDVVVVDLREERLDIIVEHLDIQTQEGSGASVSVLKEAGVANADLLIAVTELDELNIVSCIVARSLGAKKTIARVRDPEYVDLDRNTQKNALGIDLMINPERVTALEIAKLTTNVEAQDVEFFADGEIQMLELKVTQNTPVLDQRMQDYKFPYSFLVVAIRRRGKVIIPQGKDSIILGDMVFVLCQTKDMGEVEKYFGQRRTKVENVVILGGGRIGYYLAQQLEKRHVDVKIIEKDKERCHFLAHNLNRSIIIQGDGGDLQLLEDENVGTTDLFVSLTGDDKLNMLVSLLAKHLGTKKTIAEIRLPDYNPLVEKVGIDKVVSPRNLTAGAILGFVRKGKVISVTLLDDGGAEISELIVPDNYHFHGMTLAEVSFPEGAIVGAIVRKKKVIVPRGHDIILSGDRVIVFNLPSATQKVEKFFA